MGNSPHTSRLSRRKALAVGGAGLLTMSLPAWAQQTQRIKWADLIPEGVPYGEIIATGEYDGVKDIWIPEFDDNGLQLNSALDGKMITLAGYVIPLEVSSEGTTSFVLVPFIGACIHVPPPPPNQLVFVTTDTPWPSDKLWEAVLVTGQLSANIRRTDVAQVGYDLTATQIEKFQR